MSLRSKLSLATSLTGGISLTLRSRIAAWKVSETQQSGEIMSTYHDVLGRITAVSHSGGRENEGSRVYASTLL